jgi:hypothetical protein
MKRLSISVAGSGHKSDELIIQLRPDGKVLVILPTKNLHYTLHPGHRSGIIDIHKTEHQSVPGTDGHSTLFSMPREEVPLQMRKLAPLFPQLLEMIRPIRLGWLFRKGYGIIRFPSESELAGVSRIEIRRSGASNTAMLKQLFYLPKYLDEIMDSPDRAYLVFDANRRSVPLRGIVLTYCAPNNRVRLCWLKFHDITRFQRKVETILAQEFGHLQIQIPPVLA